MKLTAGILLGPYELIEPLGAGGMGEVYKARDTRLERIVAIKVLPAAFAADLDRQERFDREARAVAALSHPHICHLHDVGEAPASGQSDGASAIRFLVMEHLDGRTLQERLLRGALSIEESLRAAIEIADALDHAHRKGLIHRDLKPSNVMLTSDGAKLLDFGLSKLNATPGLPGLSTISSDAPLTETGAVLGTFPYMSPEQLQGREADARSDLFALGALVYEMVTGRRAFEGATAAAVSGAILHVDPPPLSSVQPLTPPALEQVVERCLAKKPDDRWQTARDLLLELKWIAKPSAEGVVRRRSGRRLLMLTLAGISVAAAVAAFTVFARPTGSGGRSPAILAFPVPDGLTLADPALAGPVTVSPDGRHFGFVATGADGKRLLWVRPLDSLAAQPMTGTDGAIFPFWSADSRSIGFFAQSRLKIVPATGGPVQTLCEAIQPRGGTMSASGVIVFSADAGRQLYRVSSSGGDITPIPADAWGNERYWPMLLPDGRHFIYYGRPRERGLYVADIGGGSARLLLKDHIAVAYSASGYLLTLSGSARGEFAGTLLATRFDATRLAIDAAAVPVADNVPYHSIIARGEGSVSDNGVLVYGNIRNRASALIWFDRDGKELSRLSGPVRFMRPRLSPDASTVAVQGVEPETQQADIWLIETARNVRTRFTSDAAFEDVPIWSPDGSRIVFSSPRGDDPPNLYEKWLRGPAREQALLEPDSNRKPTDWSRDGRFVVYASLHPRRQWDLLLLPMDADRAHRTPRPFLATEFNEQLGRVSPDGRWLAYVSDESGSNEIYVQTFPEPGSKRRVSTTGGTDPIWRGDGRELVYLAPDGMVNAVEVETGPSFTVRGSAGLFKVRVAEDWPYDPVYTMSRDGQRFLINSVTAESPAGRPVVVLNWMTALDPH